MMNTQPGSQSRLRTHPSERFAGDEHIFDMKEVFKDLANEPHATKHGHRQIALIKKGDVTMIAFSFEQGGRLVEHRTHGIVTIQALKGTLIIETESDSHRMEAGMLLVLEPDVAHSVYAEEPSQMLLTVHLEERNE